MRNSIKLKNEVSGAHGWEKSLTIFLNFHIHYKQQEVVTNIISGIIIALGD